MSKTKINKDSFEFYFNRLEEILDILENNIEEQSLENLLNYYQEGLELMKICRKKLSEAELKIEKIKSNQN